jgi:hypothetical protein
MKASDMGIMKGQLVYTGAFPGVVIGSLNTGTPMCEVYGIEQEMGSVYADDIRPLTVEEFKSMVVRLGHKLPLKAYSPVTKAALMAAGIPVQA